MINANRMKIIMLALMGVLFPILSAQASEKVVGKTYFTTANIWYEQPTEIDATNFHKGVILPVGTKIRITAFNDGGMSSDRPLYTPADPISGVSRLTDYYIKFENEQGKTYKIVFRSQHARGRTAMLEFVQQYFSPDDPMGEKGAFRSLTPEEQKLVMAGEIADGMSKEAVAMAYGYPPSHKTPSLKKDKWVYWQTRFKTQTVEFKDDKVAMKEEPQKPQPRTQAQPSSAITECIKACKENTKRTSEQCFDACNH